jgi:Zn-dependent protease
MNQMLTVRLIELVTEFFPAILIAVTINSAFAIFALGKTSPENELFNPRKSLNPLKHLDIMGTVFPIALVIMGRPMVFGWAKEFFPTSNYEVAKDHKLRLTASISGIMGNLVACLVIGLFLSLLPKLSIFPNLAGSVSGNYFIRVLFKTFVVNLSFILISFIPLTPFAGSKLLMTALGDKACKVFSFIQPYSILIIIAMVFFKLDEIVFLPIFHGAINLLTGSLAPYILNSQQFMADFI